MIPFYEKLNEQELANYDEGKINCCTNEDLAKSYQEQAELYWRSSNYLFLNQGYLVPSLVLLSYSCEISLKSILTFRNIKFKHQHCISYLYNLLDEDAKHGIFREFKISFLLFLGKAYPADINIYTKEIENLSINDFTQKINEYFKLDYFYTLRYRTPASNNVYFPLALNALTSATKNYSAALLGIPEPSMEDVLLAWLSKFK